ncbi:HlyD family type I secretion periplasmic adaptor subunit [Propionivibrio limicola]|uniref:HlyD family type I secretion periplasmic adaptor subunit n=1 Tax=Propionivibrio limicola TaxID=167645 RepID=UPI001290ED85|nr:HlyD family type I secretion periplasmic adaptor subunit [Propionivibrio limicola]
MLNRLIERFRNALKKNDEPINETELAAVSANLLGENRAASIGLWILGGAILVFILWALFAPLDEGVPAQGVIAVESKRKVVQHLTGGIIKSVLVKEAQLVKAAEPLVMLDDTTARANHDAARQQYYALLAQADRLHAEMTKAAAVTFSPALLEAASDPFAADAMAVQQQLFQTRRLALKGELEILAASERSAQEQIVALEAQIKGKQEQLKFVQEQLVGSRELAREGYLSRKSWFEEERLASDLQASVSELTATIARARSMASEATQRRLQRQRDYQKEVETQYSDVRREALTAAERFRSSREDFHRTVVRAPVDGAVNGLTFLTEGSVVAPGGRLMDIVPKDEALIIEAKVDPSVIDRVHPGLAVSINLHVFANDPSLVIDGVLDSISPDLVADPNPNVPPHYLGRVKVTKEGLAELGSRALQPGMPVQITIRTGERSLAKYLLKPLLLRLSSAMKES